MTEEYSLEEIKEQIDETVDLLKLTLEEEEKCLIGFSERAEETILPVYDLTEISKVLKNKTGDEKNSIIEALKGDIYTFVKTSEIKDVPDGNILYNEYESVILGLVTKKDLTMIAYDTEKCIEILEKDMEPNEDDETAYSMAMEYFYYNTVGAWHGDTTPVFLTLKD